MGSQLTTLTSSDIQRFEKDGYVVVRQAFSRADGLAMERRWWSELEDTHNIRPDDRSSWRQIRGDLKAAKRDPIQTKILTERVRGVFDDLLGKAAWSPPKDWGRPIVTFPEPGAWDVPAGFWHWDNPCEPHLDHPRGLFVVSFIGSVAPRSGGTLILSGSPRLLIQQGYGTPAHQRRDPAAKPWDRFHRSHPWLMALTGHAPSPADRIAAFMDTETIVEGVPVRVVELTGEPGDMVFCHPAMVHCGAPNRGARARFMRIKHQQNRALEALYASSDGLALLRNPDQLFNASLELVPQLGRKSYSFHSILTKATFAHHLGIATGELNDDLRPCVTDRQSAFMTRSGIMGLLINSSDIDLARQYERMVANTPILSAIEEWAFPTYARDNKPSVDFSIPGSILLRKTAIEVLREIGSNTDAYLYYLSTTYLPLALTRDPTFGLKLPDLLQALKERLEKCEDPTAREACLALTGRIEETT